MEANRFLIVNADDFGQSTDINDGVVEAHERGIVTSASVMVRWPAAVAAAAYGRANPRLSLGLHVDLGEWTYRDGAWVLLYEVVPVNDVEAVAEEVSRQLTVFCSLVGRTPTHIDSHQHVHLRKPARSVLFECARRLAVPLRHFTPGIRYRGDFYGQSANGSPLPEGVSVARLVGIISELLPGFTELGCHPSRTHDLATMFHSERAEEVKTLCNPRVRAVLQETAIQLSTFGDFRGAT